MQTSSMAITVMMATLRTATTSANKAFAKDLFVHNALLMETATTITRALPIHARREPVAIHKKTVLTAVHALLMSAVKTVLVYQTRSFAAMTEILVPWSFATKQSDARCKMCLMPPHVMITTFQPALMLVTMVYAKDLRAHNANWMPTAMTQMLAP